MVIKALLKNLFFVEVLVFHSVFSCSDSLALGVNSEERNGTSHFSVKIFVLEIVSYNICRDRRV